MFAMHPGLRCGTVGALLLCAACGLNAGAAAAPYTEAQPAHGWNIFRLRPAKANPAEQLALLTQSGQFLETDLCYSETRKEWVPLPEFLKKIEMPISASNGSCFFPNR